MQEKTLTELITEYGIKNTECNALKKEVSNLNTNIKTIILNDKQENIDIDAGEWTCKLSVTASEDLNEDKVIEILKRYQIDGVIKTKEYLDSDAFEKMIYAGQIDKEILAEINSKCKEVKTKETLYVKKSKETKK